MGLLATQEAFNNGGWWHDNRILAATGDGFDKEQPRAWKGWWNEKIVELVQLSMKQPDAMCILLTGRSEKGFADLVKKIVASKGLVFDMVCLKPQVGPTNQRFPNTMDFKKQFLTALVETYAQATEIRIYEDRPRHTEAFRRFLEEYNNNQTMTPTRGPLQEAEVIQVADGSTTLDPVVEVAEVQHMINAHNAAVVNQAIHLRQNRLQIKKTVFFTSYMANKEDSQKLLQLAQIPPSITRSELKIHANNILISPRPCSAALLDKVGGMGSKKLWEVTGTACLNGSLWAACVRPVPSTAPVHTENQVPLVVLAVKKGTRPVEAGKITHWNPLPPDQSFVFETTVGEKVILRVEEEDTREGEYETLFANRASKRKHPGNSNDRGSYNKQGHYSGRNEARGHHTSARGGSRGRAGGQPANRGYRGRGGGRGKGPGAHYRSLDDVGQQQISYDNGYASLGGAPAGSRGSSGRGRGGRGRGGQTSTDAMDLHNFY